MNSVADHKAYDNAAIRDSPNPFRDAFGHLSDEDWQRVWLSTPQGTRIKGLEFPAVPSAELQSRIHGAPNWEYTVQEAFSFYHFVKSNIDLRGVTRFLDFGCGWGRICRPFLRHFELKNIFAFEPNRIFAVTARALNPYITVINGDFSPDGSLPGTWFDLIVGWSVFSHLSPGSFRDWLAEIARTLRPGGQGVFTTWGERFLVRLQGEKARQDAGHEIHWYSRHCLEVIGDIDARISEFRAGEFIWFTGEERNLYGEAFISEQTLRRIIAADALPLRIVRFDTASLSQDAFIVQRL